MARIRTLNFLPEIFQTPTNNQFLSATLDQIVNPPDQRKIQGYIGSKFGYGINANDFYVVEPTKERTDYQLTPGVVFTKKDEMTAKDFISYNGIIDALKLQGGITADNNKLFESQIYSWDPFIDLDKIINFNQYYWIPEGLPTVNIATNVVYNSTDYVVTSQTNDYLIRSIDSPTGEINPTLTLLRGGTYRFIVDQDSQFWIQAAPGVDGTSPTQPNKSTRLTETNGVFNNGTNAGAVTFEVPFLDSQDNFVFSNEIDVDLVSNKNFADINGHLLQDIGSIDGVTNIEGKTVMFYNNATEEKAFTNAFYGESNYDTNVGLTSPDGNLVWSPTDNFASTTPFSVTVTNTTAGTNVLTVDTTGLPSSSIESVLAVNNVITFPNTVFGGINQYNGALNNVIYYVKEIKNAYQFTVSQTIGGPEVSLTTAAGSMTANVNDGLLDEGLYSFVSNWLYIVEFVQNEDDPLNPIVRLRPYSQIPLATQITAIYGTEYIGWDFYKDSITGQIKVIPYISANLNTLYYQDSVNPNRVGIIRIIENNLGNNLNVELDILGRKNFEITLPNQQTVSFTNGLKVSFSGDVTPSSYLEGEYYVQGVGSERGIELINTDDLATPEGYTIDNPIPYDIFPWDIGAYSGSSSIPATKDYITIARNSLNKNGWSRSNRWFHNSVINATAQYNNTPEIVNTYAIEENKANRPIIEFYPNLKLFNQGTFGKAPVDFIDRKTTDAFTMVNGQGTYYPDTKIYTNYDASIQTNPVNIAAENLILGERYQITNLGTTNWNTVAGTVGVTYSVGDVVEVVNIDSGTGTADSVSYTYITIPQSSVYATNNEGDAVNSPFTVTQYISDIGNYESLTLLTPVLPQTSVVSEITETTISSIKYYTMRVSWLENTIVPAVSNRSLVANDFRQDFNNTNYELFNGARIIFAADTNGEVHNKIYVVTYAPLTLGGTPVITLTEASDGQVLNNDQTVITRGYFGKGKTYYYDDVNTQWNLGQSKSDVNQPPLFDIFNSAGKSLSDQEIYQGSDFAGNKLFAFAIGTGADDPILGFPLSYSSLTNVGDIKFDVSFNSATFNYVNTLTKLPETEFVNLGYVYNYDTRDVYNRLTGWVTSVAPSVQYQNFIFDWYADSPTTEFTCDIPVIEQAENSWPVIFVYINNVPVERGDFTYTVTDTETIITLNVSSLTNTKVQVSLLSDKVSTTAYYDIPVNLNNNPFNDDIKEVNIGDIRRQYTSIFYNNPNLTGVIFGDNNFQDLGNLTAWGDKIIQNSASLVAPGTFNRLENNSLFNALLFNSREYVKFKTLLVDTVNNSDYPQRYAPAIMLDDALDQITSTKSQEQSFFWSDMVPNKAPFVSNNYTINNDIDVSYYPLVKVYDYTKANYDGVLVYLQRTVNKFTYTTQLIKDVDYIISSDSTSLQINKDLIKNDIVTINEYNQTYGSYVPNTPTKLGMYPASIPAVILDSNYANPTYFILGHDGSYNKLYGNYDPETGTLQDFRDQVLLEFEKRIFNNLKLEGLVSPVNLFNFIPGFFRTEINNLTDFNYDQWLMMYSLTFLDWIGQNRLDYRTQFYNKSIPWTYNYRDSLNKVNKSLITQGNWRGMYQYFYDTSTPHTTPWEMLGYTDMPTWWEDRYGPAPYTSNNQLLWQDMEAGYDYNNGNPRTLENAARPGLSKVLPVNAVGQLLDPMVCLLSSYNGNLFQRDWIVGDDGAVELSYRRSSTYPFDCIRIYALMNPANFYNLCIDLDNYRYNSEFKQYLVNDRKHLIYDNVQIYGDGIAKTSYINWIVDYQKQQGVDATNNIRDLLYNLDVRLVYRVAGFSDKTMLKFFVEKSNPSATSTSLLIPDASYRVLLYDNQPIDKLIYSSIIVQTTEYGYKVYGNSQKNAYFVTLAPNINSQKENITVEKNSVEVFSKYTDEVVIVPYGTEFYNIQDVAQFIMSYGAYTVSLGAYYETQLNGLEVNWPQMVAEFLYWAQIGWMPGSTTNLNPSGLSLTIDKESQIVQPLTIQKQNFVLNQNLYPIALSDLSIVRDGTAFSVTPLNQGDTISYGEFNMSNMEHALVFDNVTEFKDVIYNLTTGVRQNRIYVIGAKSAEWNGTLFASGFIYNQDNIEEWNKNVKYTKGSIVKYKNKYYTALKVIQPALVFQEKDWVVTDYNEVQKGLLPNSSTRSYESALYYNSNSANLESEADTLAFSLIGFRPRDYMQVADLTDITQVNVFKNIIKNKGTKNAVDAFKGANLPQGGIQYDVYENWAILSGKFGGVLNDNFIELRLNENKLVGNPATVSLTQGVHTPGMQQYIPLNKIFNYSTPITNPDVLPTISYSPSKIYPDAGYVNYNDIKMSSYFYSTLPTAVNKAGNIVPIESLYVRDYVWIANYLAKWNVFTPSNLSNTYNYSSPAPTVINLITNPNGSATVTFNNNHGLSQYDLIAIINFNAGINGYYVVADIVNPKQILIEFTASKAINVNGQGICLKFVSQRVSNPTEIVNLPLLSSEFTKNTVWVDENEDGEWAVYRKSINFSLAKELEQESTTSYGYSVAYQQDFGYLVADPGNIDDLTDNTPGIVYHYLGEDSNLNVSETITGDRSFGAAIAHNNNTIVISQPTSTLTNKSVSIYVYNQGNPLTSNLLRTKVIDCPNSSIKEWGSSVAISNDGSYIFVSTDLNTIYVYKRQNIDLNVGYLTAGETYIITNVGDTDFSAISTTSGTTSNKVGQIFVASGAGTIGETGTVTQISYKYATTITTTGLSATDEFGKSLATDYYADTLIVGAPNTDYSATVQDWGKSYVFNRLTQNFEVTSPSIGNYQLFAMASAPTTSSVYLTDVYPDNIIKLDSSIPSLLVNDAIVFFGNNLTTTNITNGQTYYVAEIVSSTEIKIKSTRSTTTPELLIPKYGITGVTATPQFFDITVSVNGITVQDNNYSVIGSSFVYCSPLNAGDILSISQSVFTKVQTLTSTNNPKIGVKFGNSVDISASGTDMIIGAPYELLNGNEGAVYRYTDGGGKYGMVIGTGSVSTTTARKLLLNGYLVTIPALASAATAAQTINAASITNIQATSTSDNKLIIALRNQALAEVNHELEINAIEPETIDELGLTVYTSTQVIGCPHPGTQTQFGYTVKFNESNSFVASAPTSTRYAATTFDFIDDENQDNDTVFDNNSTRWVDTFPNAGAVYMFDYVGRYNESVSEPGAYVYAQSINSNSLVYGRQPYYGLALAFTDTKVVVGTPYYRPESVDGQVVIYSNPSGIQDWSVYRQSSEIIDINRINNIQLFSAETNNTLLHLDYIDPLQGKIFGAIRQNLDFISNVDPASYNNLGNPGTTWGENYIGKLWLDTSNMRYVNYHQNDPVYNAKYWGTLFPGSDPAIYTWVISTTPPANYTGVGIPKDITQYSVQSYVNQSGVVQPTYYFWVRDTNLIVPNSGKTLSDTVMESYLLNPQASGISYFTALLPNSYALYNSNQDINNTDTVLHIGYSNTTGESIPHQEFNLVRANFADDFLPGLPDSQYAQPTYLYDRMLDSMAGVDEEGNVVPNPYLPKAVQSGVLVRPRQSFFYNRYEALKNYIQYANSIMSLYPIVEIRPDATFFYKENPTLYTVVNGNEIVTGKSYTILTFGDTNWTSLGATLVSAGYFQLGETYIISTLDGTDYTLIGAKSNTVGTVFIATGTGNGNGSGTAYIQAFTAIADGTGTGTATTVTFEPGQLYVTSDFVSRINWWAVGFDENTKPAFQVNLYSDLLRLEDVQLNTIVRVLEGGSGDRETYQYREVTDVETGTTYTQWIRIGLENGTFQISDKIYDYDTGKYGFSGNFFDTDSFDLFPSNETRWIVRCLNEQIFTNELLIHRNKALILLFEYITSETNESQNYLPWLNKTSLVDVRHTVRELIPTEKFRADSEEFLSGYINEVKPYHVVIKEFLLNYTKTEIYPGNITDFDLPATYNTNYDEFQSPQLVFGPIKKNNTSQYDRNNAIWQEQPYTNWFSNFGLNLSSSYNPPSYTDYLTPNEQLEEKLNAANYFMTTLDSYIPITATFAIVKNASGFPVTGTFKIGEELISYTSVDRARNVLNGLTRGVEGTTQTVHFPGEDIYMQLPPVIILETGSQYYNTIPKVTAVIDELVYNPPTRPAQLQAVMALDKVIDIQVLDPGAGYETLPEIVIDPSVKIIFNSSSVDNTLNTIELTGYTVQTGDSVKYYAGYVVVNPSSVVPSKTYTIQTIGTTDFTLMGAPNNLVGTKFIATRVGSGTGTLTETISLDYLQDGQWYYVRLVDSIPTPVVALYSTYADAVQDKNKIPLAVPDDLQALGGNFENQLWLGAKASAITSAQPVRENLIGLKFDRNSFRSKVTDWEKDVFYGSFFAGDYESQSVASWSLKLQATQPNINNVLASAEGFVFPIINVTPTSEVVYSTFERYIESFTGDTITLKLDAPVSPTTSGSTIGFYVGMPIKFVGNIGVTSLVSNQTYYVSEIVDETDFKVSATDGGSTITFTSNLTPSSTVTCYTADILYSTEITTIYNGIRTVTAANSTNNTFTIPLTPIGTGGTQQMYIGAPVTFTLDIFGGVRQNQVYYVTTVIDEQTFTISEEKTPLTFTLSDTDSTTNICNVNTIVGLSVGDPVIFNAMVINGTPVDNFGNIVSGTVYYIYSIDKINQTIQLTTEYNGTEIFALSTVAPNTSTSALMTSQAEVVQLSDYTNGAMTMNLGLPVSPGQVNGQAFTFYETGPVYGPLEPDLVTDIIERTVIQSVSGSNILALGELSPGSTNLYVNMPFTLNGNIGIDPSDPTIGLYAGTTYYVTSLGQVSVTCTSTGSATVINCNLNSQIYNKMPIVFEGNTLGTIVPGTTYYVRVSGPGPYTSFQIATYPNGTPINIGNDTGTMIGYGPDFITASSVKAGTTKTLTTQQANVLLTQKTDYSTSTPTFNVQSFIGGYSVKVVNPSAGFNVGNKFVIFGQYLGGTTPKNNLTLEVAGIDVNGGITNVIATGTVPTRQGTYYVKVLNGTTLELFDDAALTAPTNNAGWIYNGISETVATAIDSSNNITVANSSSFAVGDPVKFTGNVFGGLELAVTYFVVDVPNSTTIVVSATPGGSPIGTESEGSMNVAKFGSMMLLPEPFYFQASIVKYNNKVYRCLVSNNDQEFIFGKWLEIDSGDQELNALDRAVGYYQPNNRMPGLDLPQLFTGLEYPNTTYLGQPFQPTDVLPLDIQLQDVVFEPKDIDLVTGIYKNTKYYIPSNTGQYSGLTTNLTGNRYNVKKLTNQPIALTELIFANNKWVMTSTNVATPIMISDDGLKWHTNGLEGTGTIVDTPPAQLYCVDYMNDIYVAVGDKIVTAEDVTTWTATKTFGPASQTTIYGVTGINWLGSGSFVAVGQQLRDLSNPSLGYNALVLSSDEYGTNWVATANVARAGFKSVAASDSLIVAVGREGVIYTSTDGTTWDGVTESRITGSNASLNEISVASIQGFNVGDEIKVVVPNNPTSYVNVLDPDASYYIDSINNVTYGIVLKTSPSGPIVDIDGSGTPATLSYMYKVTDYTDRSINKVSYANNQFMAVGDEGLILTSPDGITWTERVLDSLENLQGIIYAANISTWTVVGDNNVLANSTDNGVTWVYNAMYIVPERDYTVQGGPFLQGYGPEELVPGNVLDTLQLKVISRPGAAWPTYQYAHNGYNVVSTEISPTTFDQKIYTFNYNSTTKQYLTQIPAQIFVAVIDSVTGLSRTLAQDIDYTVDWKNNLIILEDPINFPAEKLRVDVYEVGNGYQIVQSNTKENPYFTDNVASYGPTFDTIPLDCDYTGTYKQNNGAIRPDTQPIETEATQTYAGSNSIRLASVAGMVVNSAISFYGNVLGGLTEGQTYYIKTISTSTNTTTFINQITISSTLLSSGIAGPAVTLTNDSGSMNCVVQVGNGLPWTDPIVMKNGKKLTYGESFFCYRTKGTSNTIVTNTLSGMNRGDPIVFDSGISFCPEITAGTTYYILEFYDPNEFTIEAVKGSGVPVTLSTAYGQARFLTNDYDIVMSNNNLSAELLFAEPITTNDYIVYSIFGELEPNENGYSLPETQNITITGSSTYALDNFVGGVNPWNAIVEIDGVRQSIADYEIVPESNVISFGGGAPIGEVLTVTSYNNTKDQYFNTVYSVSGTPGAVTETYIVESTKHFIEGYANTVNAGSFVVGQKYNISSLNTAYTPGSTVEFEGEIEGTTLTVKNMNSDGYIQFGAEIFGSGIVSGTTVTGFITAGGGIGTYEVNISQNVPLTSITADNVGFTVGQTYTISALGPVNSVTILEVGTIYKIKDLGTTTNVEWNTIAGTIGITYTVGSTFTCATQGVGTGLCYKNPTDFTLIGAANNNIGTTFIATGEGEGLGSAVGTNTNFAAIGAVTVNAGSLQPDTCYIILNPGVTDFTLAGAPDNNIGTIFTTPNGEALDGQFVIGREYTVQFIGNTNWNSIGYIGTVVVGGTFTATGTGDPNGTGWATYNWGDPTTGTGQVYKVEFTATGAGSGTGTAGLIDEGYDSIPYDALLDYLKLQSPFTTSVLTIGQSIVFTEPTLGGIESSRKYYVKSILNSTNFMISYIPGGAQVTVTDETGSMETLSNSINVAKIINVQNALSPPTVVTVTQTYSTNSRIQCDTVSGLVVGEYIQFKTVRIPADQIEAGDIYRIELLGTTDWNVVAGTTSVTYKVGDYVTAVSSGTGDGVALQAYYGDLETTGTAYTIADIDDNILSPTYNTIQVYEVDGDIATLTDYSGTIYGVAGGVEATTITTELPHYFEENQKVRIDGTFGSTQLNNKVFYAHVLSPTVFAVYLTPYDPAYNAPINNPVTDVNTYAGGGYTWKQGLFVIESTTASSTNNVNDRITVANTYGLIEGTPVYFGEYEAEVGDNVIGGLLFGTEYYVKEVRPLTNAGNLRKDYQYQIATLGNTNWISLGATANAVFNGSISIQTVMFNGILQPKGVLTVNTIASGFIENGQQISGTGILPGTTVLQPLNASGGIGTYILSDQQTVSLTSITGVNVDSIFTAIGNATSTGSAFSINEFTVSEYRFGPVKELETDTSFVTVSQWQQTNVDRLWVTVNGYRVPSSQLRLNPYNELSILTTVVAGDDVTITSMTPSASPSQETYLNLVDSNGEGTVYRCNAQTQTWLTEQLDAYETSFTVNDIGDVTNIIEQNAITPEAVDGVFRISLNADKTDILKVIVYNKTKAKFISKGQYKVQIVSMVPTLLIKEKSVNAVKDDELLITIVEGNTVVINGEFIKLSGVDLESSTLYVQQRGAYGTGVPAVHNKYTKVQGLLSSNKMLNAQYYETWNPIPGEFNTVEGDPLQIANTIPAIFLKTDAT